MLNILADALLVATRFEAPTTKAHHHAEAPISFADTSAKRSWAQIVGIKR
jgi:hypothetical protein